jgi:hypothetical protein
MSARGSQASAPGSVDEPARRTPVFGEYDVVVLGGGPAGIASAAAAARNGSRTLLVERYGFLGGMGTAAGVTNFCGLHANVGGEIRQVVHGVADDLLDRMRALDGLNEPHNVLGRIAAQAYDMSAFKCAADQLLASDGVDLLFHALAVAVTKTPTGKHRCNGRRDQVGSSCGPRPDVHRLLRRWRSRALGRPADGEGRRPGSPVVSDIDVPRRQHRRRARRRSVEDDPGADGCG